MVREVAKVKDCVAQSSAVLRPREQMFTGATQVRWYYVALPSHATLQLTDDVANEILGTYCAHMAR